MLYRSTDRDLDIYAVAEGMSEKGWFVGRCVEPLSIRLMFNPVHAGVVDEYLEDLSAVAEAARGTGRVGAIDERTY